MPAKNPFLEALKIKGFKELELVSGVDQTIAKRIINQFGGEWTVRQHASVLSVIRHRLAHVRNQMEPHEIELVEQWIKSSELLALGSSPPPAPAKPKRRSRGHNQERTGVPPG